MGWLGGSGRLVGDDLWAGGVITAMFFSQRTYLTRFEN